MTVALAVFGISLAVCVYLYFGYPALIFVLGRIRHRPVRTDDGARPSMTLIVPAYNEANTIDAKIRNTLTLEYPEDKFETLVVSDGSTDATLEIATRYAAHHRLRVLALPRGGKARALNAAAEQSAGDILVFTDANSLLEPDVLQRLARNFADPEVGGVCGNKRFRPAAGADATAEGEGLYWRYDKWQKEQETRVGSIFAADGTLHAVRRALYVPIDDPAQADDIAISTRVVLQGSRLIYEPGAIAWEEAPVEGRDEFRRKIRVTNHSVRALLNLRGALWSSGFYSIELISHKLLRHLAPFFLLPLLLSNVALAPVHPIFATTLVLQVLFYGLALAGALLRATPAGRRRIFTVPYYFVLVNAAAFAGVLSIVRGRRQHVWTPRHGLQVLVAAATLVGSAGSAGAQELPVDAQIRFNAAFNDNFFQAAQNAPTDDVWARAFEARVSKKDGRTGEPLPFGRFEFVSYTDLDPATALYGGVRGDDSRSAYLIEGGFQWNRPRFEVGDEFERADIVGIDGEYGARVTPAVELKALADLSHESYELRTSKNNNQYNLGGAMRYRGFGSDFSPEVGWLWGRRDADDLNEDYNQRQFYIQVRSAALPSTYLSVRFRRRLRDYSSDVPGLGNFDREDRRNQWTMYGDVTVTPHVIVNLSYWHERSDSTRLEREFSAQAFGFGMTYRF
jgi:cellulose synthase/poly-beta-1,6-N-acetylglucosamine synthase-like glycosyltransferase